MSEMKHILDQLKNRLDITTESISEVEDIGIETSQNGGRGVGGEEQRTYTLWDNYLRPNIHGVLVSKREKDIKYI